jgi:type I restriction enzyme R subunit
VSAESTVVAEFVNEGHQASGCQSEADLERELIKILQGQAYEYLTFFTEEQLVVNLRAQLESLNNITFSDREWKAFFDEKIASVKDGVVEKTVRIQEDHIQLL